MKTCEFYRKGEQREGLGVFEAEAGNLAFKAGNPGHVVVWLICDFKTVSVRSRENYHGLRVYSGS